MGRVHQIGGLPHPYILDDVCIFLLNNFHNFSIFFLYYFIYLQMKIARSSQETEKI